MKTLITGVSTRAIAESAHKAGQDIFTIDYFGDSDQKQMVENYSLLRDFNLPLRSENLIHECGRFDFDYLVYISSLENYPDLLETFPCHVKILGNSPETLRKVRDWKILRDFMIRSAIPFPETLIPGEEKMARGFKGWLLKPTNSGGGSRIRPWEGDALFENQILQKHIYGIPASVGFFANGKESVITGMSAQLIGEKRLGASGYTWCGNIMPLPLKKTPSLKVLDRIKNIVNLFTSSFGLKGACGIDFIIRGNNSNDLELYILEINPRYTASMELFEKAYGLSIYSHHVAAVHGSLPDFSIEAEDNSKFFAKGILFAQNNIMVKNTKGWKERGIKDIPFAGDKIKAGQPVCTIFAEGTGFRECEANLFNAADRLRLETGDIQVNNGIKKAV